MLLGSAGLLVVVFESCILPDTASEATKPLVVGLRMTYSGRLVPVATDSDDRSARKFRISYLVVEATPATGYRVAWLLEDLAGTPRRSWAHRFGMLPLTSALAARQRDLPAIQAERDGLVRTIPLRPPFYVGTDRLRADAEWTEDKLHFQVVGREEVAQRRCWKVATSNNLGLHEINWVDEQERLVVRHQEAVFVGQGVAHELFLELEKSEVLPPVMLNRNLKAQAALGRLRGPVSTAPSDGGEAEPAATPELLEQARVTLAEIQGELPGDAYVDLAREVVRQTQATIDRRRAMEKLVTQAVGKPARDFSLVTLRGGQISLADFKGKPLVLHFWDYRSEPKVAPYGETGYLDFLSRQREKQGIAVVGIAVDDRLQDEATRAAARKDIRSFCEFMNLSYPVAFDEGKVIDRFGDPRRHGGKLPLYVVIAPDGTVAEYHPGLWGSTADEGLKELDQRLRKLIP